MLHLMMSVVNPHVTKIANLERTILSSSFTGVFVAYLGIYYVFFLLALPAGMLAGFCWFVLQHWNERNDYGAVDMAMSANSLVSECHILSNGRIGHTPPCSQSP